MKNGIRRLAAIALALALPLLITACGNSQQSSTQQSSSPQVSSQEAENAVSSTEKVKVRVSIGNAMDHPQALGLMAMKEYIEEKTNGNVTLEIFPNSQLGAERESVEQVKNGMLEMATAAFGPLTTFNSKFMAMDIPFLFDSYDEAWATLDSELGDGLKKDMEASDLKCLAWLENGFRHITNNIRPITQPDDLKGLKIRTMEAPMHMANFQALGANPTPVPWSELYLAMSSKIVDGQENPITNIWEIKMNEVQKYCSLTGHIYDSMVLVTNLEWFNGLPEDYQNIILEGAAIGQQVSREANTAVEEDTIRLLEEGGMTFNSLTQNEKDAFRDISQPVVIEKVKKELGDDAYVDNFVDAISKIKSELS